MFENKYFRYEGQWEKGEKHGNYLQNKDIYFSLALNITFCYLYNQIGNSLLWKKNKRKITTDIWNFPSAVIDTINVQQNYCFVDLFSSENKMEGNDQ